MDAHIPALDNSHYLQPLAGAPEGLIGDTHFAFMDFGDGTKRKACVKLYKGDLLILNEIIGHVLAVAAEQWVPGHAALLEVQGCDLGDYKPPWLAHDQRRWAWCTEYVEAPSLAVWFERSSAHTRAVEKLLTTSHQVPSIIAFDNWLANTDRNLGNLLQVHRGKIMLIDHGQIFGACNWPEDRPDPDADYRNVLREVLARLFQQPSEMQDRAVAAADQHHMALDSVRSILREWLASILSEDEVEFAYAFLERRASSAVYHPQLGVMT